MTTLLLLHRLTNVQPISSCVGVCVWSSRQLRGCCNRSWLLCIATATVTITATTTREAATCPPHGRCCTIAATTILSQWLVRIRLSLGTHTFYARNLNFKFVHYFTFIALIFLRSVVFFIYFFFFVATFQIFSLFFAGQFFISFSSFHEHFI